MADEVLAQASGRDSVSAGEYVTALVDSIMAHEAFGACARTQLELCITELLDPHRVVVILDHYSLSAAAKAVTGHSTNGWLFWRPAQDGEQ